LIRDLKGVDEEAESRMLGVIPDVAIGNHEVSEKKVIEDSIKRTIQITNVTNQLPPSKCCEKMAKIKTCESPRQILLKFSDFSESEFVISI
jgi:hypothetical protein